MFIVFEGIDGSGKSTQARLLCAYLKKKGIKAVLTKEPTKNLIGLLIKRSFLNNKTSPLVDSLLFAADTTLHTDSLIKPLLEKKTVVVSDRYYYSSLAYQSASGVSLEYLNKVHEHTLKPDIVFLLDCSAETGFKRTKKRGSKGSKYEKLDFLKKVRGKYLEISASNKNIIVIKEGSIKEVSDKIISEVLKWL